MAKKDVELYYDEICKQYIELQEELKDFTKECEEGLVAPEKVENFKEMIQPLMANYMTISYIMFLLNRPVKKKKQSVYEKQNKKILNHCKAKDKVLQENRDVLQKLQNNIKK